MNFFQRRKILKHTNFLDLHPVRILLHEPREDGGIDLLLPRFKNNLSLTFLTSRNKERHIRIRLDRTGSLTWLLIDGKSPISDICLKLAAQLTSENLDAVHVEERAAQFFSLLYRERYITFTEIEDQQNPVAK